MTYKIIISEGCNGLEFYLKGREVKNFNNYFNNYFTKKKDIILQKLFLQYQKVFDFDEFIATKTKSSIPGFCLKFCREIVSNFSRDKKYEIIEPKEVVSISADDLSKII